MQQYKDYLQDIMDNGVDQMDRTGTGTRSVFGKQLRFDLSKGFPLVTVKKTHFKSIVYELLFFIKAGFNNRWLNDHGVTIWDEWQLKEDQVETYTVQPHELVQHVLHHKLGGWEKHDLLLEFLKSLGETEEKDNVTLGIEYLHSIGAPKTRDVLVKAKGHLGPIYGWQWRNWKTDKGYYDQLATVIKNIKEDPYSRRHIISAWNVSDLDEMALPPCHFVFQFYVREGKLSCLMNMRQQGAL